MTDKKEIIPNPDHIGSFPIRTDTTVLPGDGHKLRLRWRVFEIPPDKTEDEYMKEVLSSEEYTEHMRSTSPDRAKETDAADMFRKDGKRAGKNGNTGFMVMPVLELLNGQPWNNLALNYIYTLNPTFIRATNGPMHCDAVPGRVTVILKEDNKTIDYVEQEVSPSLIGCHDSCELRKQLAYQKGHGLLDGYAYREPSRMIINEEGVTMIDFGEKDAK